MRIALACLRAIFVYLVDPKDILTVSIWSHKMHEFSPYRPHYINSCHFFDSREEN